MDERQNAAFHEAGHVVARLHYGLITHMFRIEEDGTGLTAGGGAPVFDLLTQLDTILSGPAAEDIYRNKPSLLDADYIINALIPYVDDGEFDEDSYGDYAQAVDVLRSRRREWSESEIVEAVLSSYQRCVTIVSDNWTIVERLANEAIRAPDGIVGEDVIEAAWTS